MDEWIAHLWQELEAAEWGTRDCIGTVWDLCNLADIGIIDYTEIAKALEHKIRYELGKLLQQVDEQQVKFNNRSRGRKLALKKKQSCIPC